jgi:hypothetical protein
MMANPQFPALRVRPPALATAFTGKAISLVVTATDTLLESFRARLNLPDGRLAAVAAVHTFGDYLFFQ